MNRPNFNASRSTDSDQLWQALCGRIARQALAAAPVGRKGRAVVPCFRRRTSDCNACPRPVAPPATQLGPGLAGAALPSAGLERRPAYAPRRAPSLSTAPPAPWPMPSLPPTQTLPISGCTAGSGDTLLNITNDIDLTSA